MPDKVISITLQKWELDHIINDLIHNCLEMEDKTNDEETLTTWGYYSRKALIKKLRLIESAYFPDNTVCGG